MGNYVFKPEKLIGELEADALDEASAHDFGKNIIPNMLKGGKAIYIYDFASNTYPGMSDSERGYWRDV